MAKPLVNTYPEFYSNYINLVEEADLIEALTAQTAQVDFFFIEIEEEKSCLNYAPGKWTLKELAGHMIDTERIMVYRLTCFARNEKAILPGFDEDNYVTNAFFKDRSLFSLSVEFAALRKANMFLFKSLNEEELSRIGNASGKNVSVRALIYMLAGHVIHHANIIKERYI